MTTEIIRINNLNDLSTDDLKKELARSITITVDHLHYLASIWAELENRGVDLTDMRHGIMTYLPMIAHKKVAAEIVINYAGQKTLLAALSRLPIDEQKRIAKTGTVNLVKNENGELKTYDIALDQIAARDIYQIFTENGVRSRDEQIKMLALRERTEIKTDNKKTYRKARRIKIDAPNNAIIVGNASADISRIMQELSKYFGVDLLDIVNKK